MIHHDPRFVFIHIPKTAGVSMYDVFGTPREDQHHNRLCEHEGWDDRYFKFAFVRNPWDRFLSCYSYFKQGGRGGVYDRANAALINCFPDFRSFVFAFKSISRRLYDRHFFPQVFWLKEHLDFIGRFENLAHDFATVCEHIGLKNGELPHFNRSQRGRYAEAYDEQTREIVADIYAQDIAAFGYRFEG